MKVLHNHMLYHTLYKAIVGWSDRCGSQEMCGVFCEQEPHDDVHKGRNREGRQAGM